MLGSHPHVIEPLELRAVSGSDGTSKTAFVVYSLGNLLSNQRWRYSDCGLLISLTLVKEPGGPTRLVETGWQALWVHKYLAGGRIKYRILPVDGEYDEDTLLMPADRLRLAEVREETALLLGSPSTLAIPAAGAD